MRALVANHKNTHSNVLNKLVNDSEEAVRYEALMNMNFDNVDVIQNMLASDDIIVRRKAARLFNLSFDNIIQLMENDKDDIEVQANLYFNDGVPKTLKNLD